MVIDRAHDRYLVVSLGWQGYHGNFRVQKDGIAEELEAAGVPKHDIVRAFRHIEDRAIIRDYTVA